MRGNVAVHPAVVDVVSAAGQHQARFAGAFQGVERLAAGGQQLVLELALRGVGGFAGAVARAARHPEALHGLRQALLHLHRTELEMQRGDEEFVLVRLQRRRRAQYPRQRLVPRAVVRAAGFGGGFGIGHVGHQHVVHPGFQQRLHMAVGHLHGVAGLRHRHLDSGRGDARVGDAGKHRLDAQFGEIGAPEGEPVDHAHGARQAHAQARLPAAAGSCLQQFFAIGEQVVDYRLAAGSGRLTEFIGALVAPIALLALDDEFLHVAEVGAGFADEIAGGEVQLMQVVPAEARSSRASPGATAARSAPSRWRPSRRCRAAR